MPLPNIFLNVYFKQVTILKWYKLFNFFKLDYTNLLSLKNVFYYLSDYYWAVLFIFTLLNLLG